MIPIVFEVNSLMKLLVTQLDYICTLLVLFKFVIRMNTRKLSNQSTQDLNRSSIDLRDKLSATLQREENSDDQKIFGVRREPLAVLLMTLGTSLITLGFAYSAQKRFHPSVTGFVRGLAATFVPYLIAAYKKIDLTFPSSHNFKWQMIRNGIMFLQGFVYAWSQYYLPLPIVVTLYASTPVFSAFFDWLVFGISLNKKQKMWLTLAFSGVLLTANGKYLEKMVGLVFNSSSEAENTGKQNRYFSSSPIMVFVAGIILALTQAIQGLGIVLTKKLKDTTAIHITYFVGVILLLGNGLMIPSALAGNELSSSNEVSHYHNPSLIQLLLAIIFSGLPLVLGMLAYNASLTITKHYGIVAPFQFASLVVGYLLSIFRYGEQVNYVCALGTILICIGIIFVLREREKNQSKKQKQKNPEEFQSQRK